MALPNTLEDGYITLAVGDGATPEVFTAICGLTVRNYVAAVNTADRFVRDCTDPTSVPVRRLQFTGRQWTISGNGLLARESQLLMESSLGQRRNWRFIQSEPSNDAIYGGFDQGRAVLTNLERGATEGEFVNVSLTIQSDGLWQFFRTGVALNPLRVEPAVVPRGAAVSLDILGANVGGVITVSVGTLPAGLTLNSAARTITGTTSAAAGPVSVTLTETLAGATGSPRATPITLTLI